MNSKQAKNFLQQGHFPAGSMGPKIDATINFLEHGGTKVIITFPNYLQRVLKVKAGTLERSIVDLLPSRMKSAPLDSTFDANSITNWWERSEYDNATSFTENFFISRSKSDSEYIGMPPGYFFPASTEGKTLLSIFGICAAVKHTTL